MAAQIGINNTVEHLQRKIPLDERLLSKYNKNQKNFLCNMAGRPRACSRILIEFPPLLDVLYPPIGWDGTGGLILELYPRPFFARAWGVSRKTAYHPPGAFPVQSRESLGPLSCVLREGLFPTFKKWKIMIH